MVEEPDGHDDDRQVQGLHRVGMEIAKVVDSELRRAGWLVTDVRLQPSHLDDLLPVLLRQAEQTRITVKGSQRAQLPRRIAWLRDQVARRACLRVGWGQVDWGTFHDWVDWRLCWGSKNAMSRPLVGVVSSHLGRQLDPRAPWFRVLRTTIMHLVETDQSALCAAGNTTEPYLIRAAEQFGLSVVRVATPPVSLTVATWLDQLSQCSDENRADRVQTIYVSPPLTARLDPEQAMVNSPSPSLPRSDPHCEQSDTLKSGPLRDRLVFVMANRIHIIQLRERGRLADLVRRRLKDPAWPSFTTQITLEPKLTASSLVQEYLSMGAIGWLGRSPAMQQHTSTLECHVEKKAARDVGQPGIHSSHTIPMNRSTSFTPATVAVSTDRTRPESASDPFGNRKSSLDTDREQASDSELAFDRVSASLKVPILGEPASIESPDAEPAREASDRSWLPELIQSGVYLIHCTRAAPGPWPDQSWDAYRDQLLLGDSDAIRSALLTLTRIIRQRRLLASDQAIRGGFHVVAFTETPIDQLRKLHQYRSHRGRWDFEPYGVCIDRRWLSGRGARPVLYGELSDWDHLPPEQRPFFQRSQSSTRRKSQVLDWTREREWRHLGDLAIDQLPADAGAVFVSHADEVAAVQAISPWPVFILPLTTEA